MNKQEEKQVIRKKICAARAALAISLREEAAKKVCQYVIALPAFKQARFIGLYWPHNEELNPLPILEQAIALNKYCYLPILHPEEDNSLLFLPYEQKTVLTLNKYGIPQPEFHGNYDNALAINEISIMFIPLVAFDAKGFRLGMGKGYYDETLNKSFNETQQPLFIGLGYAMQEINSLPKDHWDLQLDGVITEQGLKIFNQAKFDISCHNKK